MDEARVLRRRPHVQALLVGLPVRFDRMRLHRRMRLPRGAVGRPYRVRRRRRTLRRHAEIAPDTRRDVALLGMRMDGRRGGRQRLGNRVGDRQPPVADVDQIERPCGGFGIVGRDQRHRLADMAHDVGGEDPPVPVHDAIVEIEGLRHVGCGQHSLDARQRAGPRRVDRDDPGMRVRAAQDGCGQFAFQAQIGGVAGGAIGDGHPVDMPSAGSDRGHATTSPTPGAGAKPGGGTRPALHSAHHQQSLLAEGNLDR